MKYLTKFFDKTKLKIRKQENKTRVFHNLKKIGKNREKEVNFCYFKNKNLVIFIEGNFPNFYIKLY